MLGLLWYFGTTVAAFMLIVARFGTVFTLSEYVAMSIPIGAVVPAWVVYLIACLTSALGTHTLLGSTLIFAYLVYENWNRFTSALPRVLKAANSPGERIDALILVGIVATCSVFLVPLYSSRMIPEQDGKIWSGGSCWADLPIHMQIAESFLSGRNQDVSWGGMHSPVFAGEPMAYPFMPDFHAAAMVRLGGCNLRWAFLATGLSLCLSLLALLWLFTVRVTRSRLGGVLALLLLLGAGGQGGYNLMMRDGFWSAVTRDTAQNDSVGNEGRIVWFAFLPHVLMPQRGANFAYPLNLAVLMMIWRAGDVMDKRIGHELRRQLLLFAAGLAGLLPLVQAHSFVAMACIIGVMAALDFHKWMADPRLFVAWAQAGVLAFVEAYPQMRLYSRQVESGSSGHFIKYGFWYANHEVGQPAGMTGFFKFWWANTGPALMLYLTVVALLVLEICYALLYAEAVRSYAGGASAGSAPSHSVLDQLYNKEQPVAVWASISKKANAKASASAAGFEYEPSIGEQRQRRRGDSDDDEVGDGWNVRGSEWDVGDEDADKPRRPTTPQLLAMSAHGSGLGRAPGSNSVELRIAHLAMEYTLPGVASNPAGGDPPRYKLETQGWEGEAGPMVVVSHVGGGAPDMGLATSAVSSFSGQGTREGAGAQPSGVLSPSAPPPGAKVARAFDPTYEVHDAKRASYFAAHVWAFTKLQLAQALGVHVDDLFDPARYSISAVDRSLWVANRLSANGRAWDTLKLALGAGAVFVVGNYINFQPWDRDNCKLFYIWIMINAMLAGSLLAAPVEFLFGILPGTSRLMGLLPIGGMAAYGRALYMSQADVALPVALYPPEHRLMLADAASPAAAVAAAGKKSDEVGSKARHSSPSSASLSSSAPAFQIWSARTIAIGLCLIGPWLLFRATLTGFMMIYREYGLYHVLLDEEQIDVGKWIREHIAPKAVMVHKDIHITPSGCLAGRPTLVAYTGWMWSHGYNYAERDRDRNYIVDNCMKDSDSQAYNLLRRWGARYVIGEGLKRHPRVREDSDMYLDGQLKRVYSRGRFDIMEVLGYGFPAN